MAKSRDDKPSEWHVDTKGIGLVAVGKIRKKDECLHIRAGCIRARILLKNAQCISKSAPQRGTSFPSLKKLKLDATLEGALLHTHMQTVGLFPRERERLSSQNVRK